MKKIIILSLIFIITMNIVSALDCQYTEINDYTITKEVLVSQERDHYYNQTLNISDFGTQKKSINNVCPNGVFKVSSPFNFEIQVIITLVNSWDQIKSRTISILPKNYFIVNDIDCKQGVSCDSCSVKQNTVQYEILEPEHLIPEYKTFNQQEVVCKECNGKECLNDGDLCPSFNECGGGYCIEGQCSNDKFCFNNNCKCSESEIQCDNNQQCVKKNTFLIDTKPECNKPQECVTGYINVETGLCAKSPSKIQEEENQRLQQELSQKESEKEKIIKTIIILISLILIGVATIWYLKIKNEKEKQKTIQTEAEKNIQTEREKQKTIQKEIELEAKKIQSKEFELNELKDKISQIKKHKKLEKNEIKELNKLKSKRDKLIEDINNQYEKITKPFPDKQASNRLVVINPYLGGYKCFLQKGINLEEYPFSSLIHRWVWKKHNGRNPKKGHHIHHIDGDKYNNDSRNLEEIEGKEHYKNHRKGI